MHLFLKLFHEVVLIDSNCGLEGETQDSERISSNWENHYDVPCLLNVEGESEGAESREEAAAESGK